MMLRMIKLSTLAVAALGLTTAFGCSSGDPGGTATTAEQAEELKLPPRPAQFCGGIAGFPCPEGQTCVDDPSDDCDPANGGADCGGICVASTPAFCGGIAGFPCPAGQVCIDDPRDDCDPKHGGADCGGICVPKPGKCDYSDPSKRYVAKSPKRCSVIRFVCRPGERYFSDACGCGCQTL
jgi:hypothetical protein